jgi:hypothetical protein
MRGALVTRESNFYRVREFGHFETMYVTVEH